ncbi:hypothetical protein [Actinomadura macrotermitis]|uniref:Uncharacterized protein n=1 Tax=Actinomadura macrotermitis TaxID=2585200 RepID=A0A7K0BVA1_9ACTN|nr:hypothetical protein [Actinomadura macrotermitis]MQY04996.1 hypothetical protein [Actinomadura macrotermitis]
MDANTVIATCATFIAVLSLGVSFLEARATRRHNRYAVRPLLELWFTKTDGGPAGIVLVNRGMGPAIITRIELVLDGRPFGDWDRPSLDRLRSTLPVRPEAATFRPGRAIPAGYETFLLKLQDWDRAEHAWFSELIDNRLQLQIGYESLYGSEGFTTVLHHQP